MRVSRIVVIALVVVVIAIVGLYALGTFMAASTSSPVWHPAAAYPLQVSGTSGVAGQQCGNGTSYLYCIGGQDANGGPRSETYFSSALSSSSVNITGWTLGSDQYPKSINGQSCVAYSGYVYCVGGTYDDNQDDVASSYFAPLSSSGAMGSWTSTTSYPVPTDSQSCVTSMAYIYCVGGNNETDGTNADSVSSNSVWYAQLSSSGVGAWSHSTAYPKNIYFPSCFAAGGFVYCLGGADGNNNPLSADYYAPLSPTGVGAWTQTTAYPVRASGQACVTSSGYIYCVGGEEGSSSFTNGVFCAPVSSGGIGAWKQAPNYPLSVSTTCADLSGYVYCVGGFDGSSAGENGAVYYAAIASLSGATTSG